MARNEEEPPPWGLTTGLQVRRRKCIPQESPHWISVLLQALLGLRKEGTQTWNGRLAVDSTSGRWWVSNGREWLQVTSYFRAPGPTHRWLPEPQWAVFSHVCFWKEAGKEGWVGEQLEYLFLVFLGGCSLKGRS